MIKRADPMRHALNASNLHVGGGVQVAASVLSEMAEGAGPSHPDLTVAVSSQVHDSISNPKALTTRVGRIARLDVFGLRRGARAARECLDAHDRVFTIFGPLYRWRPPFFSIVGFAQPWIIYPDNEVYCALPRRARMRQKLKFWIQSQYFKRADMIVVELDHVKDGLVRQLGIAADKIKIVRNCVADIYRHEDRWDPVTIPEAGEGLRLGFLGRNYIHKNTRIFPGIVSHLRDRHGIKARFYVTFTDAEWQNCSPEFRKACVNVGPLSPAQCPTFYEALDAVVFPSLLECFSVTPLEAMVMRKPLFASDRPFNRDICGAHAAYFDPMSAEAAADQIAAAHHDGRLDVAGLEEARQHAFAFSNPGDRARRYLELLEDPLDSALQD